MKWPSDTRKKRWFLWALTLVPVLLACLYYWTYLYAQAHGYAWFDCAVRKALGFYCPGCGGSRAVVSLCRGEYGKAFFYYPPLFVFEAWVLSLDLAALADKIRHTDRYYRATSEKWLLAVPISILAVFVFRLAALCAGWDILGDFSG